MTDNLSIISGDNPRKSRYNPNLADELNAKVADEERRKALDEKLKGKKREAKAPEAPTAQPIQETDIPKRDGFIYVPSIDFYVGKERVHLGKSWDDAHKELAKQESSMLTIHQFKEFLKYLKDENNVYQNREEARLILDDILTARSPWRGEWLDALFVSKGGVLGVGKKMHIAYAHKVGADGNLTAGTEELLNDYLASDRTPGINLEGWLNSRNKHGLPDKNILGGDLSYWHPREGCVAGFYASSDWAALYCNGIRTAADASLGVRHAVPRAKISGVKS